MADTKNSSYTLVRDFSDNIRPVTSDKRRYMKWWKVLHIELKVTIDGDGPDFWPRNSIYLSFIVWWEGKDSIDTSKQLRWIEDWSTDLLNFIKAVLMSVCFDVWRDSRDSVTMEMSTTVLLTMQITVWTVKTRYTNLFINYWQGYCFLKPSQHWFTSEYNWFQSRIAFIIELSLWGKMAIFNINILYFWWSYFIDTE